MKRASNGVTSLQLIEEQKKFFGYMNKYFPPELLDSLRLRPPKFNKNHPIPHKHVPRSTVAHQRLANTSVQFSKSADNEEAHSSEDTEVGGVNITQKASTVQSGTGQSMSSHGHRAKEHSDVTQSRLPSVDELGFEHVQYPSPLPSQRKVPGYNEARSNQWLNSLAARLCWDIWHEQRWKDWVMSRIKRKLIRVKTPRFMEKLRLTNIDVGNDMPMVNRLIGGPRMDLRGIWVYLDVTYQGKFVMTIETKMKLGGGGNQEEDGKEMTAVTRSSGSG
jgi:hypothetical protein